MKHFKKTSKVLLSLTPFLLVSCERENLKPDKTLALESKISELESLISSQRSYTLQVQEEHEEKIRQLIQAESSLADKLGHIEKDLASVNNNSENPEHKIHQREMQIDSLESSISHMKTEILMNSHVGR
jgi:hypothetical protein